MMVTRKTMFLFLHAFFPLASSLKKRGIQLNGHMSIAVEQRRCPMFCLMLIFIFVTVGISEADFQGTIGTRFTITGSEFGIKKPKVYVEYASRRGVIKKVSARVEEWSDTSVTCLWTKQLPSGVYNLLVQPNSKAAASIPEGTFSIMDPVIDAVTPVTVTTGATVTLNGQFFTDKKPIVYMQDLNSSKRKRCRVLNSTMDPATGASMLDFVVPEWTSNNYEIILQTYVGETLFEPLTNWYLRTPATTEYLNDVAYGNDTFVAVGDHGTIVTSSDGATWTSRPSGTANALNGITFDNGNFVTVGTNGTILTSPDGVTWTSKTSGTTDTYLNDVTYGNGTFAVVGGGGTILTSPDGVTWMSENSGTTDFLERIIYGDGIFVVIGTTGPVNTILTSPDGLNWTSRKSRTSRKLYDISYGNDAFVAVGDNVVCTSHDGVAWKSAALTSNASKIYPILSKVVYANGIFVSLGSEAHIDSTPMGWYFSPAIFSSADGINWTERTFGSIYLPNSYIGSGASVLSGIAYGNDTIVAVGKDGKIIQSVPLEENKEP